MSHSNFFVFLPTPIDSVTVPIVVQSRGRFIYVLDNGSPTFLVSPQSVMILATIRVAQCLKRNRCQMLDNAEIG